MIEVLNVSRRFGKLTAVDDVTFSIEQPEVFALLGPNGSGKSTLLRTMCGYLTPNAGRVRIGGCDMQLEPGAAKAQLGYVPDEVRFYPRMRVDKLLELMARLKGVSPENIVEQVESVCDRLDLRSVQKNEIGELSRGFRQRLAIAQALLNEPFVVLMDEPTNGLDPHQIRDWRQIVRTIACDRVVVFTSHVLSEVSAVADRVGILKDGKLLAIEPIDRQSTRLRLIISAYTWDTRQILDEYVDIASGPTRAESQYEMVVVFKHQKDVPALVKALSAADVDIFMLAPDSLDLERRFFETTRRQGND